MSTTAAMKIQSTKNYDQFTHNPKQRTFKPNKVRRLMAYMKRHGFTPSYCISAYRGKSGKLIINAGHHRLAAARELGIPVLYVIEHEWTTQELSAEGSETTAWTIADHVANYAKDGCKDYQELLSISSMGIPLNLAASMLAGEGAGSGNAGESIKLGTFKIRTRDHINAWIAMHKEFGDRVNCITHRTFIQAWSKCMFTPEFDQDTFTRRLRMNPLMLDRCSNEDQMLRQIEDLYNFKSPKKIPIAFLVSSNSRSRKKAFGEVKA
jgi:hypothetical protein